MNHNIVDGVERPPEVVIDDDFCCIWWLRVHVDKPTRFCMGALGAEEDPGFVIDCSVWMWYIEGVHLFTYPLRSVLLELGDLNVWLPITHMSIAGNPYFICGWNENSGLVSERIIFVFENDFNFWLWPEDVEEFVSINQEQSSVGASLGWVN